MWPAGRPSPDEKDEAQARAAIAQDRLPVLKQRLLELTLFAEGLEKTSKELKMDFLDLSWGIDDALDELGRLIKIEEDAIEEARHVTDLFFWGMPR